MKKRFPNDDYVASTSGNTALAAKPQKQEVVVSQKSIKKKNKAARSKAVFGIMLVVAVSYFIIFRFVAISEANIKIQAAQKEYESIVSQNSRLQMQLDSKIDLRTIEQVATQKLGMQRPEKYQIIYINVPQNDSVTLPKKSDAAPGKTSADISIFSAMTKTIGNVLDYLY